MIGNDGPTPTTRRARSASRRARSVAPEPFTFLAAPSRPLRPRPSSCSMSEKMSLASCRVRLMRSWASWLAVCWVMCPRSTASSRASCMRSRVSMTRLSESVARAVIALRSALMPCSTALASDWAAVWAWLAPALAERRALAPWRLAAERWPPLRPAAERDVPEREAPDFDEDERADPEREADEVERDREPDDEEDLRDEREDPPDDPLDDDFLGCGISISPGRSNVSANLPHRNGGEAPAGPSARGAGSRPGPRSAGAVRTGPRR